MINLLWAYLVYVFFIHSVLTYDDMEWGLGKRFLHSLWRGVWVLVFGYFAIKGFQAMGLFVTVIV